MSLPKLDYPIFSIEVPSIKKSLKFRPFLVKEEKLLLMAKESEQSSDILTAIKQVINNCLIDSFDVNKLAIFDLEIIFLKLRAASVDNIIKVTYKDYEDENNYDFEIDLNDVKVTEAGVSNNIVKITDSIAIQMKYPPASLYDDKEFLSLEKDQMFHFIGKCIDKIFSDDSVYETKDCTNEEIEEFLDSLPVKTFDEINKFLVESPKLSYTINYKNSLGNDRVIELSSLNDFFMWR